MIMTLRESERENVDTYEKRQREYTDKRINKENY